VADDLREILEQAKRDCPDVPPHAWSAIERSIRANFGAQRAYIASQKKGRLIAELEACANLDAAKIAEKLGVSVQYARRLKKLR
jgi:hypothetical protein